MVKMNVKPIRSVAIVGATGAVGVEAAEILTQRKWPCEKISLFASGRSAGKKLPVLGRQVSVQELTAKSFDGVDCAIFSAGADRSREFAPAAVKAGAVVVDNSSAFRMDAKTPLVVPEINPGDIEWHWASSPTRIARPSS